MSLYERRTNQHRTGLLLLLLDEGTPTAFVKAMSEHGRVTTEAKALEAVETAAPSSFTSPRLLARGEWEGWGYLATTPLPPVPHRMLRGDAPDAVLAEIRTALSALPRPTDAPGHWQPAHGDFTPWNLRTAKGWAAPVLIDWEEAGWAPPGTDRALYRAAMRALGHDVPAPEPSEATTFLADKVDGRIKDQRAQGAIDPMGPKLLDQLAG